MPEMMMPIHPSDAGADKLRKSQQGGAENRFGAIRASAAMRVRRTMTDLRV